ncbi:hypothetical protein C4H11_10380 [Bacteroides zoogleoformans]|uniref:Uncharacterized protein n=1 Tax=Bacteroides zoogleoformans TaxID=28119 RepID=A0ABM6T900_9BACE|nr:hypothetical protein C4H11_10380 [Bacteroides zoogleoformans]
MFCNETFILTIIYLIYTLFHISNEDAKLVLFFQIPKNIAELFRIHPEKRKSKINVKKSCKSEYYAFLCRGMKAF